MDGCSVGTAEALTPKSGEEELMKAMTGSIDTACFNAMMLPAGTASKPVTCTDETGKAVSFAYDIRRRGRGM